MAGLSAADGGRNVPRGILIEGRIGTGGGVDGVRHGLVFVLRLALVLGGLGFASVFAVALLVGGIYLIATGHPSGGYALVGASALTGVAVLTLVLAAVVRVKSGGSGYVAPAG